MNKMPIVVIVLALLSCSGCGTYCRTAARHSAGKSRHVDVNSSTKVLDFYLPRHAERRKFRVNPTLVGRRIRDVIDASEVEQIILVDTHGLSAVVGHNIQTRFLMSDYVLRGHPPDQIFDRMIQNYGELLIIMKSGEVFRLAGGSICMVLQTEDGDAYIWHDLPDPSTTNALHPPRQEPRP